LQFVEEVALPPPEVQIDLAEQERNERELAEAVNAPLPPGDSRLLKGQYQKMHLEHQQCLVAWFAAMVCCHDSTELQQCLCWQVLAMALTGCDFPSLACGACFAWDL
jgi:hypothetical protein